MKSVLVPLVDGFEEIEAVACIDILRRAGIRVVVAGLTSRHCRGGREIGVETDTILEAASAGNYDAIVLPGGPGTPAMAEDERLRKMIQEHHRRGALIAAICAAPTVLAKAGIIENKTVTSYPTAQSKLGNVIYSTDPVVHDGNIITSRGAGTAVEFALQIVARLEGKGKCDEIAAAILHQPL